MQRPVLTRLFRFRRSQFWAKDTLFSGKVQITNIISFHLNFSLKLKKLKIFTQDFH